MRLETGWLFLFAMIPAAKEAQAAHHGSLPIDPPPARDDLFVVDTSPGLDTRCTYRVGDFQNPGGPLKFTIPIPRVVGETNPDGTLKYPAELIANKVISRDVTLVIPTFGVNSSTTVPKPIQPERDRITVNGKDIGTNGPAYLTGFPAAVKMNSFTISAALIRFGTRNKGSAPTPGMNEISIDIDTANAEPTGTGIQWWCLSLDWAYMEIRAMAPVIMIHGNNSSGAFFDGVIEPGVSVGPGLAKAFKDQFIPYDNSINMVTATTNAHAGYLGQILKPLVAEFGAKWAHLVVHSKGGLDSREFMARYIPPDLGIVSLNTLSTPNQGSAGADYMWAAQYIPLADATDSLRTLLSKSSPPNPGTSSLTTATVRAFNAWNLPALRGKSFTIDGVTVKTTFLSLGAEANLDGSANSSGPTIQVSETGGCVPPDLSLAFYLLVPKLVANALLEFAFTETYRLGYTVASATVGTIKVTANGSTTTTLFVSEAPATGRYNDFAVSELYSTLPGLFIHLGNLLENHATITNPSTGAMIIRNLRSMGWQ